jgi:hypothetical protein
MEVLNIPYFPAIHATHKPIDTEKSFAMFNAICSDFICEGTSAHYQPQCALLSCNSIFGFIYGLQLSPSRTIKRR